MKLCSFSLTDKSSFGIVKNDAVIDLGPLFKSDHIHSIRALLEADALDACHEILEKHEPDHALSEIRFEPVIPNPGKILCVGINYHAHKVETGNPDYVHPMFFPRYADSLTGHERPLLKPPETERLDYEGEMAVIIKKGGRRIKREDALSHVAGYSCFNDGSVRNYQRHTTQFLPGKNFVNTGGFGPWMVTTDEIPDPGKLELTTRLNSQVVQSVTTDLMINPVPVLIEYISTVFPLQAGDVIVSGTPGGVGDKREPPLYMHAGDIVEVDISQIGTLRNRVENETVS